MFPIHQAIRQAIRRWPQSDEHYNITLDCNQAKHTMDFVITCKHSNPSHKPICRARLATGHGTSNFSNKNRACNTARGMVATSASGTSAQSSNKYRPAKHRVILVMKHATHNISKPAQHWIGLGLAELAWVRELQRLGARLSHQSPFWHSESQSPPAG
jgi:hypothetical protein